MHHRYLFRSCNLQGCSNVQVTLKDRLTLSNVDNIATIMECYPDNLCVIASIIYLYWTQLPTVGNHNKYYPMFIRRDYQVQWQKDATQTSTWNSFRLIYLRLRYLQSGHHYRPDVCRLTCPEHIINLSMGYIASETYNRKHKIDRIRWMCVFLMSKACSWFIHALVWTERWSIHAHNRKCIFPTIPIAFCELHC